MAVEAGSRVLGGESGRCIDQMHATDAERDRWMDGKMELDGWMDGHGLRDGGRTMDGWRNG